MKALQRKPKGLRICGIPMTPKPNPRRPNLLLAVIALFALLLILLRMLVFVHGRGRHAF